MLIQSLSEKYIDQFIEVVDEYREFCGFKKSPEKTKAFFENLSQGNKATTLIAIDEDDQVMGFVNLYPSYSTLALSKIWILNDLGVSSKFKRLGVAQALIEEAINFASQSGAVRIELKTAINNEHAQKLYSRIGFKKDNQHTYYRVPIKK